MRVILRVAYLQSCALVSKRGCYLIFLKQVSQRASKLTHFVRNVTRHASKVHKCPTFLQEYTRLAKYAKIAATIFTRLEVVKCYTKPNSEILMCINRSKVIWNAQITRLHWVQINVHELPFKIFKYQMNQNKMVSNSAPTFAYSKYVSVD